MIHYITPDHNRHIHFKLQIQIEASSRRLPHCSILRDENSHDLEHMTSLTFLQDTNFRLLECNLLEIYYPILQNLYKWNRYIWYSDASVIVLCKINAIESLVELRWVKKLKTTIALFFTVPMSLLIYGRLRTCMAVCACYNICVCVCVN